MQNIAYSNTSDAPPSNVTINWTFNDGNYGAQGDGGALAAIGSTTVNIIAVNDAPTSLNTTVITNEDTAKALTLLDFPFNDIDTESALFNVKITTLPTKGTLTLDGVKVTANQEISTTDINSGKLIFTPEANANGSNYSFFGFEVSDGTAYSISANKVTINVTAVNDAPIITSGSAGTVEENVSLATIIYDANASDVDTGTTLNYSLSGTDTALLNIDSRSGKVTLKASANYEEKNSYDFNVIASDGILNATKAVTVSVININEAPTSTNTTITTNEDTPTVLSLTNFAFNDVDVGSTFLKIKITTLPIKETLKLDGVAVTANQEISVADINSGKLIFTPKANANGTGYTSFEFKVSDGTAYSISANKITIDVTAVRDDMNLIGTAFNDTLNGDTIDKGSYDTLNGLAGNDILNGKLGNDTMTGGAGKDTFVFNTTLSTINIDTITDFNAADDTIHLENAIFTKLKAKGILNIDYFKADNTGNAIDGNDYILYNTSTGVLSYDADGNGTGSAIQIALIGTITHPTLSVSDFVVI
jgi:Ca2+-binding RTX toxin-like protein